MVSADEARYLFSASYGISADPIGGWGIFEQDGRTRFCLNAPKATSLAVSLPGGPCWPLEKGEDGRWRGTLELEGGFRYVDILMDGETVLLPQLPIGFGYSRTVNFLDVPAKEDGYYQLQDVPHGSVARHYYPSTVTGNTESCLIYCPPDSEGRPLPHTLSATWLG